MQITYNDSVDQLLSDIRTINLLTKDEMKNLLLKIKKGCERSKDRFIISNLRLVVSIAKQFTNKGIPIADLIQEGSLGLIRAAEKFDVSKEIQFSTYATWWIKQKIRRALTNQVRMIKVPDHLYHRSIQLNDTLYTSNTSKEEVMQKTNLTAKQYNDLLQVSGPTVSLESKILHYDKPEELVDTIPDDKSSSLNTDNSVDNDILKQQIKNILNWLNTREKTVLTLRFGLDDGKARTQKEVGKFLNVSAERIRQIEFKALALLRDKMQSQGISELSFSY
jgi:RNA polymerase primary sigma factor